MGTPSAHYSQLFATLYAELGAFEPNTRTGIVGFSAGGPASMRQSVDGKAFVTCELSLYSQQKKSSEGENYELLTRLPLTTPQAQCLLTALGNLSMECTLGHRHTIDVSGVTGAGGLSTVRLLHFTSSTIDGGTFGIYEVQSAAVENEA